MGNICIHRQSLRTFSPLLRMRRPKNRNIGLVFGLKLVAQRRAVANSSWEREFFQVLFFWRRNCLLSRAPIRTREASTLYTMFIRAMQQVWRPLEAQTCARIGGIQTLPTVCRHVLLQYPRLWECSHSRLTPYHCFYV